MGQVRCSSIIPGTPKDVFNYLIDPTRLHVMIKEFIDVELQTKDISLLPGSEVHFTMKRWGFLQPVGFRVSEFREAKLFSYRQIEGLFVKWIHTQTFTEYQPNFTQVVDIVDFEFPMGWLGHLASDIYFKKDFKTILESRLAYASEHFQNFQEVSKEPAEAF